jgi:hypothetical protein
MTGAVFRRLPFSLNLFQTTVNFENGLSEQTTCFMMGVICANLCNLWILRTRSPPNGVLAVRAQGIGGVRSSHDAGPPQAAMHRGRSARARSPAKPGFLRSKKCAQRKIKEKIVVCLPTRGPYYRGSGQGRDFVIYWGHALTLSP